MAYTDYLNTVEKMYIAYYQRPADPVGLIYWAEKLDQANGDMHEIIDAFANSTEAQSLYGNMSVEDQINAVYQAAFNRNADPEGLEFYSKQIKDGKITLGSLAIDVLNGAKNDDAIILNNKVTAALEFTKAIDPDLDGHDLTTTYDANDIAAARSFLKSVDKTVDTVPSNENVVDYIKANIADANDPINAQYSDGKVYTVTGNVDVLLGTSGDDIFVTGGNSTNSQVLGYGDQLDGAAGDDILYVNDQVGNGAAIVKNIETIQLSGGTAASPNTYDALYTTASPEGTTFKAEINSVNAINNIESADFKFEIKSASNTAAAFDPSVVAGNQDSIDIKAVDTAAAAILRANGIEEFNLESAGSTANNVTLNSNSATTINVSGDQDLTLAGGASIANSFKKLDASALSGNLTAVVGSAVANQNLDILTGSGNDTITVNNLDKNDKIDLGDGTDTLKGDVQSLATLNIKNMEQVELTGLTAAANIDKNDAPSLEKVIIDRNAQNVTVKNITDVDILGTQARTVLINPVVANSTVNVLVDNTTNPAGVFNTNVANLTTQNTSVLNIDAQNTQNGATATHTIAALNTTASTLNVSGVAAVNITSGSDITSINAQKLQNAFTYTNVTTTKDVSLTGSNYNDNVTLNTGNDSVYLMDGNDIYNLTMAAPGKDYVDFGNGNDTLHAGTVLTIDATNSTFKNFENISIDEGSELKISASDVSGNAFVFNANEINPLVAGTSTLTVIGDAKDNKIDLNGVSVTLTDTPTGTDAVLNVNGGGGNDTIDVSGLSIPASLTARTVTLNIDGGAETDTMYLGKANENVILGDEFASVDSIHDFDGNAKDKIRIDLNTFKGTANKIADGHNALNQSGLKFFAGTKTLKQFKVNAAAGTAAATNVTLATSFNNGAASSAVAIKDLVMVKEIKVSSVKTNSYKIKYTTVGGSAKVLSGVKGTGIIVAYDTDDHKLQIIGAKYTAAGTKATKAALYTIATVTTVKTANGGMSLDAADIMVF